MIDFLNALNKTPDPKLMKSKAIEAKYTEYGERLLAAVKTSNIDPADLCRSCKISVSNLNAYTSGRRLPRLNTIKAICEKLNISIDYIAGLSLK